MSLSRPFRVVLAVCFMAAGFVPSFAFADMPRTAAPASIHLSYPNGGETMGSGYRLRLYWTYTGTELQGINLLLSANGGDFNAVVSGIDYVQGTYEWTVPSFTTGVSARLRIELIGLDGSVAASDDSDGAFYIYVPSTISSAQTLPALVETFDPSATISSDRDLKDAGTASSAFCKDNELVKLKDDGDPSTQVDSAVYYCGRDGRRYAFPNTKVFTAWYADFSKVKIISKEQLASLPFGGNVTHRPGARLVKIQSDPKTYAVGRGGLLRLLPDEATAAILFGPHWSALVDDLDVAFFASYRMGTDIVSVR